MLIDTHCHLDFSDFDKDRDEVIARALSAGIGYIVNIGSSINGSMKSLELSSRYACIYAAIGIHPHEADNVGEKDIAAIKELAKNGKVVAIGETGLDYYKNFSKQENQRQLFISLLKLARDSGLPVVLHSRAAGIDMLRIVKGFTPFKAVVHCFSAEEGFLKACLDLGFFISFTCNITYKKAENLRSLVKITPLEKVLLETDAPFLPPEGLRGERNEPLYVKQLAAQIAGIKGIKDEEVAQVTTKNAKDFFNLP